MTIICDLDGTLTYLWDKYYYSHTIACKAIRVEPNELENYRQFLRSGGDGFHAVVEWSRKLNRRDRRIYWQMFRDAVERAEALSKDRLLDSAVDFVKRCPNIYLVTFRRHLAMLLVQLDKWGIRDEFTAIRCGNSKTKWSAKDKAALIPEEWIDPDDKETWWIGDSEIDMEAAKILGIKGCAVISGLRGEQFMRGQPYNRIIAHVGQFPLEV